MGKSIARLSKPGIVAIVSEQAVGNSAEIITRHQGIDLTHQRLDNVLGQFGFGRHRENCINEFAVLTRVV